MLLRDGTSQSVRNHAVSVQAPPEKGLLGSDRTQFWV